MNLIRTDSDKYVISSSFKDSGYFLVLRDERWVGWSSDCRR